MLLEAEGIRSGYGKAEIIHGVNLDVGDDEVVTIIGPNGSGKSTLLKTIVGLLPCWEGTVTFNGEDISDKPAEDMVYNGICFVPQRNDVFPSLTVRENLLMGGWALEDDDQFEAKLEEIVEIFPILDEFSDRQAQYLSGGQRRMLGIGSAMMVEPDLLVVDEPSAGLAPDLVDDLFERIAEINESGAAILMTEQNARRALQESDRGLVLVMGEARLEGTGQEILDSPQIGELYIGKERES